MKTIKKVTKAVSKARAYIKANIASILKNANSRDKNFAKMVVDEEDRLSELHKMDITKKQLDTLMSKYATNASKIFVKEAKFQGKGEIGDEYKKLAKLKKYSFND